MTMTTPINPYQTPPCDRTTMNDLPAAKNTKNSKNSKTVTPQLQQPLLTTSNSMVRFAVPLLSPASTADTEEDAFDRMFNMQSSFGEITAAEHCSSDAAATLPQNIPAPSQTTLYHNHRQLVQPTPQSPQHFKYWGNRDKTVRMFQQKISIDSENMEENKLFGRCNEEDDMMFDMEMDM